MSFWFLLFFGSHLLYLINICTGSICILRNKTTCDGDLHTLVQRTGIENPMSGICTPCLNEHGSNAWVNSKPAFKDLDNDGDYDLILNHYYLIVL